MNDFNVRMNEVFERMLPSLRREKDLRQRLDLELLRGLCDPNTVWRVRRD